MDILSILVIIIAVSTLNMACFFISAKVWQKVVKGEPVEMPSLDPMKAIREHNERKAAAKEVERYETIVRNIDNYDGTGMGQEDVPRG